MKHFRACLTALFALVLFAGSAQAGVLAYYPFDNDFNDASGNNNHLTVAVGTPTITSAAGEFKYGGGALDADSTTADAEYLNLTNPITFLSTDAWSVAFWVRRRPGTDNRSGMVIGNPANSTDFIWTPNNPSVIQGLRFRSSTNANANFGGFPDDNQYHHWVVIADGAGTITSYRDNVPQSALSVNNSFSITSVAHAFSSTVQSMDGQIDELYIFDEAIDAATVSDLFNNVPEPGTVALLGLSGVALLLRRRS